VVKGPDRSAEQVEPEKWQDPPGVAPTTSRQCGPQRHPDLLPEHRQRIADTLAAPDQVRRSARFASARLFTRWFESVRGGKHVVVVVVSESAPSSRPWVITAYIARKLAKGEIEWKRD
jgi:hypothetical protein